MDVMKATASVFLGVLTFLSVFGAMDPEDSSRRAPGLSLALGAGLLSLVLAAMAFRQALRSGWQSGKGSAATAGVVITLLSVLQYYYWRAVDRVRIATDLTQVMGNLKQLGMAMLEYEKANGALPPTALYGRDDKPLLSWRVLVLPYLEQEDLFKQFRLDEPWDSVHNLALLPRMPEVYAAPEERKPAEPYTTFYQVIVGKGTAFEPRHRVALKDILGGPSENFLVVEGGHPVPWTKPEDISYEPDRPLPELGGIFRYGFAAGMADGSVHMIHRETSEATIRAFISRNGKDKPGGDW